jgi:hypothetical protein
MEMLFLFTNYSYDIVIIYTRVGIIYMQALIYTAGLWKVQVYLQLY